MNIIIDNGGTKADWAIKNDDKYHVYETSSINKNETLRLEHKKLLDLVSYSCEIVLYSTGVFDETNKRHFLQKITDYKPHANVEVYSDILGASRSVAHQEKSLIAILGTGSNACFYNGNSIQNLHPSLGYIIGDEGSGSQIGKELLKAYFYSEMPTETSLLFDKSYNLTKTRLISDLNTKNHPARYLASFAKFANDTGNPYAINIVREAIKEFLQRRILSYDEFLQYPIHFVGSIAYFYSTLIKELCAEFDLKAGNIVQKPITGLIKYYNE